MNTNSTFFQCDSCELAKHRRSVFPPQIYKEFAPFTLILSDVWGPSRVVTLVPDQIKNDLDVSFE